MRIVLVGKRAGKAVVNWPGVFLAFLIILFIVETGGAIACWLLGGDMDSRVAALGLIFAIMATGIGLRRARTMPLERLVDLDAPLAAAPAPIAERIQRQVKAPAIALQVFGILNSLAILTILATCWSQLPAQVKAISSVEGGLPMPLSV
ncbi:MAG: hypothetical protein FJ388_14180, partial [Verrucomicrobia bacterium]|nr:hypothetical protein [Verrucomicrobiota bacterium]